MSRALLDGKYVPAEAIDPTQHRFIGLFRPAQNPLIPDRPAFVICPCGMTLQTMDDVLDHYRKGCCDVPQFLSIELLPPQPQHPATEEQARAQDFDRATGATP